MLTFHKVRLTSVSMATSRSFGEDRCMVVGDRMLTISETLAAAARAHNSDLKIMAQDWFADGGRGYLVPVVAEFDGAFFAGYIDVFASSLTLQLERSRHRDQAMGFAICAARLRSVSDRSGNHLPTRVLPSPESLGALLDNAGPAPEMAHVRMEIVPEPGLVAA